MVQLTKFQQLKMYLPVNGYDTLKELAADWDVTERAIRDYCRGKFASKNLERLTNEFIREGERRFTESHKEKLAANSQ